MSVSSVDAKVAEKVTAAVSVVHGIDVSVYQGTIDWLNVAAKDTEQGHPIGFAYIKATDGPGYVDPQFAANWRNSRGLLPRGAYHFFLATATAAEVSEQADNFIRALKGGLASTGETSLELPPMVDVEWGSVPGGVSVAQAVASLQSFLLLVERAFGMRPIIYTGPAFWQQYMGNTQAFSGSHLLWIATYGAPHTGDEGFDPPAVDPQIPGGWASYAIWQSAVQRGVAGIQGLVDRDQVRLAAGTYVVDFLNEAAGRLLQAA
jgi:lysozyme